MTNKQLANQLYQSITSDFDLTEEQVILILKLQQSFETDEERTARLEKFRQLTGVAKIQHA